MDKVLQLVQARPLMAWSGILASILLIILIATTSLLSPIASNERRISRAALGSSTTQPAPTKQQNPIPLWLFGAIALTCTAGSIVISKHLAPVERPYRRSRHTPPWIANRQVTKHQAAKRRTASRVPPCTTHSTSTPRSTTPRSTSYLPTEFSGPVVPRTSSKQTASSSASKQSAKPARAPIPQRSGQLRRQTSSRRPVAKSLPPPAVQVPTTVVPAEANHPLDWDEPSLADVMDLRRQRSLSSWMEER